MRVHVRVYVCVCGVRACVYACACVCVCMHVHVCVLIDVHTYILSLTRRVLQEKEDTLRANLKREQKKLKLRTRENVRLQRQVSGFRL